MSTPGMTIRRHRIALLLLASGLAGASLPVRAASTPNSWTPGPGWNLVWADEFNGPAIDPGNWVYDLGGGGWGNNELETYTNTAENSFVQNGDLVIRVLKSKGNRYTSARLKTLGKRSWQYGKVAARIRLPYGQGIWPAFWMMGNNMTTVGWPRCGEIDVMELIGGGENRDDTIYGTAHWADANGNHQSRGSGPVELPDPQFFHQDYHVFELEWNATTLTWRLDGRQYFTLSIAGADMDEFRQPFFLLLNVAVGGNWPGSPNRTTVFPQEMRVDWVRVYQAAP